MAAESKQTEGENEQNANSSVASSTPFVLFGPDQQKWIRYLPEDRILISPPDGSWASIGVDHVIDPRKTTSFEIMPISLSKAHTMYFSVGFAAKGVINTPGFNHVGMYMQAWDYYCNGNIHMDTKYTNECIRPIALEQRFKLEIANFNVNFYVQGFKIGSRDLKEMFSKHKDTSFYFCVSMCAVDQKIKIVDFQASKE